MIVGVAAIMRTMCSRCFAAIINSAFPNCDSLDLVVVSCILKRAHGLGSVPEKCRVQTEDEGGVYAVPAVAPKLRCGVVQGVKVI